MVLLKLTLAPILIALVSLAERRWGAAVSGAMVGFPLTSGPILFFLALEQGKPFSARTSVGSLLGLIALAVFALVYALMARRRGWLPSLVVASVAYIGACVLELGIAQIRAGWAVLATCAGLALVLLVFPAAPAAAQSPRDGEPNGKVNPGRHSNSLGTRRSMGWGKEVLCRMITAAALVFLLTAIAQVLGPVASGLAAMYPIYSSILAAFNHLKSGAQAMAVVKGVVVGSFGGTAFFAVIALALERLDVGTCFLLASAAGLAVEAVLLPRLRMESRG